MAVDQITPSFTTVPILSLAQARDPSTKPAFLQELRDALLNVGFLYLSDTGLPKELVDRVCEQTFRFFDEDALPLVEKEKIEMKNEKSFLGWSRVGLLALFSSFRFCLFHFIFMMRCPVIEILSGQGAMLIRNIKLSLCIYNMFPPLCIDQSLHDKQYIQEDKARIKHFIYKLP